MTRIHDNLRMENQLIVDLIYTLLIKVASLFLRPEDVDDGRSVRSIQDLTLSYLTASSWSMPPAAKSEELVCQ